MAQNISNMLNQRRACLLTSVSLVWLTLIQ
jgi:hypothetical protein